MNLERYREAKFNNITFFTPSQNLTWGQRTIIHNYPKSNRTEVEFMGLGERQFSLEIVLFDENIFEKIAEFEKELNKAEYGTLIHPIDGEFKVAVSGNYQRITTDTELGQAKYSVTFQVVSDSDSPDEAETFIGKVLNSIDEVLDLTNDFLNNNYLVELVNSYEALQQQVLGISDQVLFQARKIGGTLDDLFSISEDILSNPFKLVSSAEKLSEGISDLVGGLSILGGAEENYLAFNGLFDQGDDIVTSDLTAEKVDIQKNTNIINITIQLYALVYCYKNSSEINFLTYDKLNEKIRELEAQYQKLYPSLSGDLKSSLDELRSYIYRYFSELELYNIIEVEAHGESLNVFLYRYYGNLDFYDQIKELNNIKNPAFIEGTMEIYDNDTF